MNINHLAFLFFAFSVLIFSNCENAPTGSVAHQEAVKSSERIKNMTEIASEKVGDMKEKREEMLSKFKNQNDTDSNQASIVLSANQSIAKGEGILEKLKTMMEQHKNYIEKHENIALGVAQIQAQHDQIKKDLIVANEGILELNQLHKNLKTEHEKITNSK